MAGPMARPTKARVAAIAYLRTSSATNVGADKDSDKRQRQAIEAYAKHAGHELVGEFYDKAVSGADPIETRPGFAAMLERIESNGVRTIIVETANRFARDLMVQEVGYARLQDRGITLIAADSPNAFQDDTPTAKLVRQVLGAIAEFDKAMTVAKLRGARERKRKAQWQVRGAQVSGRDASRCRARGQAPWPGEPQIRRAALLAQDRGRARQDRGGAGCYRPAKRQGGGSGVFRTQRPALQRQERAGDAGAAVAGLS